MKNIFFFSILLFLSFTGKANSNELDQSPWHIVATDQANYNGIALSNGRIGIIPSKSPFKTESIILNNVYEKSSKFRVSRLLKGINFANLGIVIDGDTVDASNISNWKQVLNLKEAFLTTSFQFKGKAEIEYSIFALRGMPYAGLIDVTIKALDKNIKISVSGEISWPFLV